jgi:polyisoprenoid-binding protein YceI
MKLTLGLIAVAGLCFAGGMHATGDEAAPGQSSAAESGAKAGQITSAAAIVTVPLAPQNSRIQFVCAHIGDRPDPRTGGFEKFKGMLELDRKSNTLKSVELEIDTASLTTEIPKLTNHLKSPDFFEVRQHPTATFKSSGIKTKDSGKHEITGKLTLHGVTKEIKIPATLKITSAGPTLHSEFDIDRTDFGMNFGPDRVEKKVTITVAVGEKAKPRKSASSAGAPDRG